MYEEFPINRTLVELKPIAGDKGARSLGAINRTLVELKLREDHRSAVVQLAINRTLVELKRADSYHYRGDGGLSIVP